MEDIKKCRPKISVINIIFIYTWWLDWLGIKISFTSHLVTVSKAFFRCFPDSVTARKKQILSDSKSSVCGLPISLPILNLPKLGYFPMSALIMAFLAVNLLFIVYSEKPGFISSLEINFFRCFSCVCSWLIHVFSTLSLKNNSYYPVLKCPEKHIDAYYFLSLFIVFGLSFYYQLFQRFSIKF